MLRVYVELGLNVRMLVDDLCVNVYLDIRFVISVLNLKGLFVKNR